MKSKTRKITVNGIEYIWTIAFNKDGDGGLFVKIFYDRKEVMSIRFSGDKTITPGVIRDVILYPCKYSKELKTTRFHSDIKKEFAQT